MSSPRCRAGARTSKTARLTDLWKVSSVLVLLKLVIKKRDAFVPLRWLAESLLHRRCLAFFRIVRSRLIAFHRILRVVVVVAKIGCTFVSRHRAIAIALCVVRVAHLDIRPDRQPRRAQSTAQRRFEIVDREIVISLLEEQKAEMIVDPRV